MKVEGVRCSVLAESISACARPNNPVRTCDQDNQCACDFLQQDEPVSMCCLQCIFHIRIARMALHAATSYTQFLARIVPQRLQLPLISNFH